MAKVHSFPDRYHLVWLDDHIGDPQFCIQLKRAFFTNIAADSEEAVSLSDKDIDATIRWDSEMNVSFENFHFTLQAFNEEEACLKYIERVKHDRILVITSNKLGKTTVPKILEQFPETFTNSVTGESYDSVYVFCHNMIHAISWAIDYIEYIKIYTFEMDLLARITRDLGDEFLNQGEKLLQCGVIDMAIERLSWAKSSHIRHEKYQNQNTPKTSSLSQFTFMLSQKRTIELIKIDQLLDKAEQHLKEQQQINDDDADVSSSTASLLRPDEVTHDHHIVWLDEQFDSCGRGETVSEACEDRTDAVIVTDENQTSRHYVNELTAGLVSCFPHGKDHIQTFDEVGTCQEWIKEVINHQTIFLILSNTYANRILPNLDEHWKSIKKIYIFGQYLLTDNDRVSEHRNRGVQIGVYDTFDDLLVRIMRDLSMYYSSKADKHKKSVPTGVTPAFKYLDQSKLIEMKIHQLQTKHYEARVQNIEGEKSKTKQLIQRMNSYGQTLKQRLQMYNEQEDENAAVVLFFVGYSATPVNIDSDIGYTIVCQSVSEFSLTLPNLKASTSAIIIASVPVIDNLPFSKQLIHYYYFAEQADDKMVSNKMSRHMTHVKSHTQLINELYHELGQYYRTQAIALSKQQNDAKVAKLMLQKSTKCYELLKSETEKAIKLYAELMKKPQTK